MTIRNSDPRAWLGVLLESIEKFRKADYGPALALLTTIRSVNTAKVIQLLIALPRLNADRPKLYQTQDDIATGLEWSGCPQISDFDVRGVYIRLPGKWKRFPEEAKNVVARGIKTMMIGAKASAFLFILCLAFCATALAQNSEKAVKMKDLPEAVRKTVHEQSSGAKLRGLTREVEDGKTFYEAELEVNGHNKDVLIDPSGSVVEIEEQVPFSSVPAEAQATIKKHAGKGKITVVESITKNNSVEAYEAHVNKAGKRSEIKVTPDGKLIDISKENEEEKKDNK